MLPPPMTTALLPSIAGYYFNAEGAEGAEGAEAAKGRREEWERMSGLPVAG
jgi:hypothetical protein